MLGQATIGQTIADEALMVKLFDEWMFDHGRAYKTQQEKLRRFEVFRATAKEVHEHNISGSLGLIDFADKTTKELRAWC